MKHGIEYMSDSSGDRLVILENRAAELGRRLGESAPVRGVSQYPAEEFGTTEFAAFDPPTDEMYDPPPDDRRGYQGAAGYRGYTDYEDSGRDRAGLFGEAATGRRRRGPISGGVAGPAATSAMPTSIPTRGPAARTDPTTARNCSSTAAGATPIEVCGAGERTGGAS